MSKIYWKIHKIALSISLKMFFKTVKLDGGMTKDYYLLMLENEKLLKRKVK